MGSANESQRYIAMSALIGWAHTQNDPLYVRGFLICNAWGWTLWLSILFYMPYGHIVEKYVYTVKIFTWPASICMTAIKLMGAAGKISMCRTWKITWPMKWSCKVYMPMDNINMPQACGHALCQALFWILGYLQCVMSLCDRWEFYPIFQSSKMPAVVTGCAVRMWDSLCCLVTQDCLWPNCID